VKARTPGYTPI